MNRTQVQKDLQAFKKEKAEEILQFREILISNLVMTAQIPSATFEEEPRAQHVLERFLDAGLNDAHIDDAGNVIASIRAKNAKKRLLLFSHMDSNYDSNLDHNVTMNRKTVSGVGVAYNALGVSMLMTLPEILTKLAWELQVDITFLATTKSQGRGDMEGIRYFIQHNKEKIDFAINMLGVSLGRIDHFSLSRMRCDISCNLENIIDPNWSNIGDKNAIIILNDLINRLLTIPLPNNPRTLLNFGKISGGESYHGPSTNATLSLEIRSEADTEAEKIVNTLNDMAIYIGSKYGVRLDLNFFGRQRATELSFTHPLVKTAYEVVNTLGYQPFIAPTNTEITVLLARKIPAITLGLTTGGNPLLPDGYVDISPMTQGLLQILMIIYASEKGYCDETGQ